MWRKRASGWRGGDGFRFVDAVFEGGVECASAVNGQASNIILAKNGNFSCCFLDAHLVTKAEGASPWIEFTSNRGDSAIGLHLANAA